MEEDKIVFELAGDNLKLFRNFEKEHSGCFSKYPNLPGSQYVFEFFPTSTNMRICVKCLCGKKITFNEELMYADYGT